MKAVPKQSDYDIIARATPSCMLSVLSVMEQALADYEGIEIHELARAKRLVFSMQNAALAKLDVEKVMQKEREERAKRILNPAQLPTLLEGGEQAKDFYLSKGITVLEPSENGKEYSVDLPLDWVINMSSVSRKYVLFDHNKKRVGSFERGGVFTK